MSVPVSKRAANDKWDKENMTTLGCKVKKEDAAAFKAHCKQQGKTSNTVLKDYVIKCIAINGSDKDGK
jgi:hypothetical protein